MNIVAVWLKLLCNERNNFGKCWIVPDSQHGTSDIRKSHQQPKVGCIGISFENEFHVFKRKMVFFFFWFFNEFHCLFSNSKKHNDYWIAREECYSILHFWIINH